MHRWKVSRFGPKASHSLLYITSQTNRFEDTADRVSTAFPVTNAVHASSLSWQILCQSRKVVLLFQLKKLMLSSSRWSSPAS